MAEQLGSRMARSVERLAENMEKPLLDNRSYRVIKLPNQLEALLVHDPDTDKASAAMDVNVGSFSDEDDMQGMAHAVEHLLFMGTEKYPEENEYNQYLTKYGGYSNAFTAPTSTNYYFELSALSTATNSKASSLSSKESLSIPKAQAPLYGALDRFAQFFVRPLFLEDTLDRELKAVDSENKKNLQSDNWRLHQLNKSLSSKKHPFHLFSTGNYKILHDDPIGRGVKIRDRFMHFYDEHYSANRMKLVVLGRESLDELQGWVEEHFSEVRDQNLPQLRWDDAAPYSDAELGTQIFAKPVMDQRMLDIYFLYPDEENLYKSQPGKYISHLIGHEGPGSVLAYIKAKGWANGLGSGPMTICPGAAFFSISIRLTEKGQEHYRDVIKVLFQYIAMIKEDPPHEWIVEEMKRLAEVDFKFRQKIPASRTTSHLSGVMQKPLPRDWLLSGQSLIREFNPEAIKRGLSHLRPDNFRLTLVSPDFPGDWNQKEQWYGTEYKYERIPQDFMSELVKASRASASERPPELYLPAKNEFVPSRLDVEVKETSTPLVAPKLIRNDESVRTWFKKDDRFWVPKATINVCLRSPLVNVSPLAAVTTQIYKELVQDSLSEYSYDAELAGLDYTISNHAQGLDVSVSGYNDKMSVLLEKVLVTVRDLEVKEDRFNVIKERLMRGFRNFDFQQPFHQIGTYSRWLAAERGWINEHMLAELPSVTADDVRAFFPQILRQLHIEILVHGNLYREDALKVTDLVQETLRPRRLPPSQWPIRRSIVIPPGSNYIYPRQLKDPANVNHCIEYMIFVGANKDRALRARLLLFAQIADEPCFDVLRTKEQLGYVVGSGAITMATVAGYRVLIQSEKNPEYLEKRIEVFLTNFEKVLQDMPEHEFQAMKVGLINKRLERVKNLAQETGRFWAHVTSEMFDFEQADRDVENIEPLTKDDMIAFYKTHFHPASPTRAKASVHLIAQTSPEEVAAHSDPAEQKAKLMEMLAQYFASQGLPVNAEQLSKRLEN
ncbi:metalloprotease, partial [Elasticomyces elasticus]